MFFSINVESLKNVRHYIAKTFETRSDGSDLSF